MKSQVWVKKSDFGKMPNKTLSHVFFTQTHYVLQKMQVKNCNIRQTFNGPFKITFACETLSQEWPAILKDYV